MMGRFSSLVFKMVKPHDRMRSVKSMDDFLELLLARAELNTELIAVAETICPFPVSSPSCATTSEYLRLHNL
jgi:hypothetical protein